MKVIPLTRVRALGVAFAASLAIALALPFAGCSGQTLLPSLVGPTADIEDPISGVADRGDDPAVVAVESNGIAICAGALVAADVVLTAKHCAVPNSSFASLCASAGASGAFELAAPSSLGVLVAGDEGPTPRAQVASILVPQGPVACGADIAMLRLDRAIDDIRPLAVRATGIAQGDHVRTVGLGVGFAALSPARPGAPFIVVDHVPVLTTTERQFLIGEAACDEGCGGPAVDDTGPAIVGVVSGSGIAGDGGRDPATDVGTRTDPLLAFIAQGLEGSAPSSSARGQLKTKKGAIDMGANCEHGADCAAGVCVTDGSQRYCSRACDDVDRCPARFRCVRRIDHGQAAAAVPLRVCIEG